MVKNQVLILRQSEKNIYSGAVLTHDLHNYRFFINYTGR